jgi:hypothetical protein
LASPEKAARMQFEHSSHSGWYQYTQREGAVPLDPASQAPKAVARVTQECLRFCEALGKPGDCRKLMIGSPVLTGDGRYALWMMTIYAAMWLIPEPVFSMIQDERPERTGKYRAVAGMRIDPSKPGHAKVFRPWGWTIALIVSEEIKEALERIGTTGTKFKEV